MIRPKLLTIRVSEIGKNKMKFHYEALNRNGRHQHGYIEAVNRGGALNSLRGYELHILKLKSDRINISSILGGVMEVVFWLMICGLIADVVVRVII